MGVADVKRVQRVSKTGKPYEMLILTFDNGYIMEVFLSAEQSFILQDIPTK